MENNTSPNRNTNRNRNVSGNRTTNGNRNANGNRNPSNSSNRTSTANRNRRKKKKKINTATIIFLETIALIAFAIAFFVSESKRAKEVAADSNAVATQTTVVQNGNATSAEEAIAQATEPVESTTEVEHKTGNSASKAGKSFYEGVKYRSPTAKTADIYKHGRELMLLNNDWELPEDFYWDLVYWSNGQDVDALSLNKRYNNVMAVDRSAYQPLKDMFAAAAKAGVPLEMVSPYRSILKQDRLFEETVRSYIDRGYSESDAIKKANYSRTFAGTSEHNTGFGFDILEKDNWTLSEGFDKTPQFKWLMEHAAEYGFILRYAKDKTNITGIMYEPWHFRYVGVENAKAIKAKGMCLEEYIAYLDGDS